MCSFRTGISDSGRDKTAVTGVENWTIRKGPFHLGINFAEIPFCLLLTGNILYKTNSCILNGFGLRSLLYCFFTLLLDFSNCSNASSICSGYDLEV